MLQSLFCFFPVNLALCALPLYEGGSFTGPLGELFDGCGVGFTCDEGTDGFSALPD